MGNVDADVTIPVICYLYHHHKILTRMQKSCLMRGSTTGVPGTTAGNTSSLRHRSGGNRFSVRECSLLPVVLGTIKSRPKTSQNDSSLDGNLEVVIDFKASLRFLDFSFLAVHYIGVIMHIHVLTSWLSVAQYCERKSIDTTKLVIILFFCRTSR